MQLEPPQEVEDFFNRLCKQGQRIDPNGEWIWLPHPDPAKVKKEAVIVALPVIDNLDTKGTSDSEQAS